MIGASLYHDIMKLFYHYLTTSFIMCVCVFYYQSVVIYKNKPSNVNIICENKHLILKSGPPAEHERMSRQHKVTDSFMNMYSCPLIN